MLNVPNTSITVTTRMVEKTVYVFPVEGETNVVFIAEILDSTESVLCGGRSAKLVKAGCPSREVPGPSG